MSNGIAFAPAPVPDLNRRDFELADHDTNSMDEHRHLRSELEIARDRLELALTGGNIGMWDWNPATSEVFYSDSFKAQLGYPPEVPWCTFEEWESRLHPDDHDQALATVADYFARRMQDYKSIFRLRCRDESYRWILAQGKGVFSHDGPPIRMTGVHVDITDQVNADRELKRVNEALKESNVELQQFAYVASHDLQTPLRAIAGFAQFLQKDYAVNLDDRANDYIRRIVSGVKRMQAMINDLLAYSRVESRASEFETVSLDAAVMDAVELLDAVIQERQAELSIASLPDVYGDAFQVSQLLTNLIGNALKYNHGKPVIRIWSDSTANERRVCIEDNGIGIDEKYHQQIFEIFRRLHSREEFEGTGIGLAVCRRIVKRHGWTIHVEPNPQGGSRFWICMPILFKPNFTPAPSEVVN
ncbi:sensor histidine kinase [Neorhodopirellula pilleata]|uniref:histidine kinase n=1 Tax=Neorhodopirellula pilleata TaxID=2714738 RepID=A0A5C6AV31_9BACT|nr:PAS domain-containing sensor histidine kinase [Neorhodopirellula pilleata]TWU03590.1 Phytochrome-like protein cph1 [Neorhodopirellula pilleata]